MRWEMGRESENVEDRRGMGGGFGRGVQVGGIGGLGVVAVALIAMFLGVDPRLVLDMLPTDTGTQPAVVEGGRPPADDQQARFVSTVLGETEDTWHEIFNAMGRQYQEPRLVLFDGRVQSACGIAGAATGPFYCPGDERVYLDLSFFDELERRFEAPGDFARAYVIAHEVGHHVQTLLGITGEVDRLRQRSDEATSNRLSVRVELQADCLAGLWARHTEERHEILEPGDIEEAMNAASAVGDDRIQRATRGYVVPDAFTHGSAAQRVRWFHRGFDTGNLDACNTFDAGHP
ncbi:neutral zinc metallopeptidase [Benzoatithermus flavus]|uniref:Neutral zinc metallopeptidase n=1 Tax=Benzoatithermus flavus TaxID=3108223 RepID=A0ABU8XVZ3_9PROT